MLTILDSIIHTSWGGGGLDLYGHLIEDDIQLSSNIYENMHDLDLLLISHYSKVTYNQSLKRFCARPGEV